MPVLMLINTTGLDYDDRLRKEVLSLQSLGHQVEVLAMEYANKPGQREIYGGILAKTIRLRSRGWFARTKGIWFKSLEMYAQFLVAVLKTRPDVLWVHCLGFTGLMPLFLLLRKIGFIHRLVWDQHELPSDSLLSSKIYMWLYQILVNGCDAIFMANQERRDLIHGKTHDKLRVPIQVLNNYPDRCFQTLPRSELSESVLDWLQGKFYVLAQGGANPNRHLDELTTAIMQQLDVKLIVVGPYQEFQIENLVRAYGDAWRERILFVGFVPQLDIAPYIDHAIASIVFYATLSSNSRLCAPNRLYQALVRGLPVMVGPNLPMQKLVLQFDCGVVVDHSDVQSINQGIDMILSNREHFHHQALIAAEQMIWDEQNTVVESLITER